MSGPRPAGSATPGGRRGRRRVLRILSWTLFAVAVVAAAEAALTLAWKEPVTTAIQWRSQQGLERELKRAEAAAAPAAAPARAGGRPVSIAAGARRWKADLGDGDAVARLVIPSLGVSEIVVQGTTSDLLRRGPGHYPDTSLPGLGATTAIAGHRTTWGAPFRHIDDLDPGDEIVVELPYGTVRYRVTETRIIDDQDFSILSGEGERLVLTACHPLYSASERIAVVARPEPAGTAGRPT